MHADILPIATILITYCLFIVYFIFWVAHRACTKTRTPGLWTMDYGRWTGRWTMDDGRWTMDDGRWTMELPSRNIFCHAFWSRKQL